MKRIKLDIDGMTCGHCVKQVHDAIATIDGVDDCDVRLDQKAANVTLDDSADMGELIQAVSNAGYRVAGFSPIASSSGTDDEATS